MREERQPLARQFTVQGNEEWQRHRPTEYQVHLRLWQWRINLSLYLCLQVLPRINRQGERSLYFATWADCAAAVLAPDNLAAAELLTTGYLQTWQREHELLEKARERVGAWASGLWWKLMERLEGELEQLVSETRGPHLRRVWEDGRQRLELAEKLMRVLAQGEATARLTSRLLSPVAVLEQLDEEEVRLGIEWLAAEELVEVYDVREEGVYLELL